MAAGAGGHSGGHYSSKKTLLLLLLLLLRATPGALSAEQASNSASACPLAPGTRTLQLLHNWNQLHMRTEYEDHPGFENRRHLLRLWLTHPEDARPLDPTCETAAMH